MRRSRTPAGFTVIELLVVVAIVGILASIALPNFAHLMKKTKQTEVHLAIDKIRKSLSEYLSIHNDMPPSSTGFTPSADMCSTGTGKTPPTSQATWDADPAFQALQFHLDEPGYFQYTWIRTSATEGTLFARADFDCDTILATTVASWTVIDGTLAAQPLVEFTDD